MTTAKIRERLLEYVRYADDKKVQAIYTMVEDEIIQEQNLWEDEDFLAELRNRIDSFESGEDQGSTWEEVKAKTIKAEKS